MQTEFLKKKFPIHRTNALKRQIMNFSQKDNETFYQCCERFKDLLNACPHHGYETWCIISFFYESLTPKMRQFVEMMCSGEFLNKISNEAFEYFDLLVEKAQSWDTIDTSDRSRASTNPSGGGKYQYREDEDLSVRVASLTRKLEAIELRSMESILCLKLMKFVEFLRPSNTLPMNALQFQLFKSCCMIKRMQ